jgi:hypothetical protein
LPLAHGLKIIVHNMDKIGAETLKFTAVIKRNGTVVSLEKVEKALQYLVSNNR